MKKFKDAFKFILHNSYNCFKKLNFIINKKIKRFHNFSWKKYSKNWEIKKHYPVIKKKEIVEKIKENYPTISKKRINAVVNKTFETITDNVSKNQSVYIKDFGIFKFLPAKENRRQKINNIKFKASKNLVKKLSATTWTGKYWSKVKNPIYFWENKNFKKSLVVFLLLLLFTASITTISVVIVNVVNKETGKNNFENEVDYGEKKLAIESFSNSKNFIDIEDYANQVVELSDDKVKISVSYDEASIKDITTKVQAQINLEILNPFLWKDSKTNENRIFDITINIINNNFIRTSEIQQILDEYSYLKEFIDQGEFINNITNELILPEHTALGLILPSKKNISQTQFQIQIILEDEYVWEDNSKEDKWFSLNIMIINRVVDEMEVQKNVKEALLDKTFKNMVEVDEVIKELNKNPQYEIKRKLTKKREEILYLEVYLKDGFIWKNTEEVFKMNIAINLEE